MKLTDEQRELIIATATKHIGDRAVRSQTETEIRSIFAATPAVHRAAEPLTDAEKLISRLSEATPKHDRVVSLQAYETVRSALIRLEKICVEHGYNYADVLHDWLERTLSTAPLPRASDAVAPIKAWATDDGRVISDSQKQAALREGGASASAVRPYSIALGEIGAPQQVAETTQELARGDAQATCMCSGLGPCERPGDVSCRLARAGGDHAA